MQNKKEETSNPLLNEYNTPYNTPPFNKIEPHHFLPAIKESIERAKKEIEKITANKEVSTFENSVEALEKSGTLLNRNASLLFNLNMANTCKETQKATGEASPLLSQFANDITLNSKLFERIKEVYKNRETQTDNPEQAKLLEDTYRSFVRNGALLNKEKKEKLRSITAQLSQLSIEFGENVLAETNDFSLNITKEKDLEGVPPSVIEAAKEAAQKESLKGWLFTLHAPSFIPFMKYASNRELREKMFKAFTSRGNNDNKHNNCENILKQASLRLEKAKLLGYKNHAQYVLEERMAKSPQKVISFLDELYNHAFQYGKKDVEEVEEFARKNQFKGEFQRWDYAYYAEKLKNKKFNLSEEILKPYFQLENIKEAIFNLTGKLWGVNYKKNETIPKYHKDVETYEVYNEKGSLAGILYMDFHPRKTKQGGAWMTSFREQHKSNNNNIPPIISIVCNFTAPSKKRPALLTFNEVTTFVHEFGHALHGLLSDVTYESLSGTNVFQDFVELPSQLLENWAREKEWLKNSARHYITNEPIDEELTDRVIASEKFQEGYATVRQLSFGFNDMAWHTIETPVTESAWQFEKRAMAKTELFPTIEKSCMSTAFSHIFDGGYSAGYYGYKWAEVLDADAWEEFQKNGIYDKETAQKFKDTILAKGGTKHPMELYKKFKGKEPSVKALIRRCGFSN
ncbi:M3 family metallopeptidase [Marinilabiliaceae bacterium ANBcel2]|nr:M3 family metallopeptidase [Marinilabiliaceae bacterium ANBcel2]